MCFYGFPLHLRAAASLSACVLPRRHANIEKHFPGALGVDDFMSRLEVALGGFGEWHAQFGTSRTSVPYPWMMA